MATIKTKFRSSSVEGRDGALYYQVIHNRVGGCTDGEYMVNFSGWYRELHGVTVRMRRNISWTT